MTQHDTHDIVRTSCIAATTATLAATGLLAITADGMFRFAIDTRSKNSIFRRNLIAPDRNEKMNMGEAKEAGEWFEQAKQPVRIVSSDGLRMHGWLFDPDCAAPLPHAYAICVHGYTGAPAEMAKWAHRYARLGFTVLTPAQRGHELSEGRYVGMGWLERNDLLDWIRLIVASDPDARILLYGGSMGASTVMNTVGDPRLPRNVVAGIAESGYSSARDEFVPPAAFGSGDVRGCGRTDLPEACGLRFHRGVLRQVVETCGRSHAVHPRRRRSDGEPAFPRHELQCLFQHRSRTAARARRRPYGKFRRGTGRVLA